MPSLVEALAAELAKLPTDLILRVIELIRQVAGSENPREATERAILAASGEAASEAALKEALK